MLKKTSKKVGEAPRYGRGTGIPNPIDVHVGKRIRMRRLFLGMNQETLANALGLTFQQVQKYEGGANRVSASRLSAMADILAVPIAFFFGDLQTGDTDQSPEEQEARERMERPETLLDFIATLERALGRTAVKQMAPMQLGDVVSTYADIGPARRDFGFAPTTPISEGIARFVAWYREYNGLS